MLESFISRRTIDRGKRQKSSRLETHKSWESFPITRLRDNCQCHGSTDKVTSCRSHLDSALRDANVSQLNAKSWKLFPLLSPSSSFRSKNRGQMKLWRSLDQLISWKRTKSFFDRESCNVSEIHLAEVERDSLPDELDFYETRVADKVLRDAVESIWQSWCWFIALIETTKSEKKLSQRVWLPSSS